MKKKLLSLLLACSMAFSLCACGGAADNLADAADKLQDAADKLEEANKENDAADEEVVEGENAAVTEDGEDVESSTVVEEEKTETVNMGIAAFDELLAQLPLTIVSTQYVVQDEQYKALYPDMLQAVLQNNTQSDIKNAMVAFVAWDVNNLPVKVKGSIDFSDGSYIKPVSYGDINLVPGATFGETSGFQVDETCGISSFKAVVVSFETFGGETWENPYYDEWCKLYEGVKYTEDLTVDVTMADASFNGEQASGSTSTDNGSESATVDAAALEEQIAAQELKVISTQYVVQDEQYKSLYPDMLQAVLENNTQSDIKNAIVAFVAWDENNLPVKIKGSIDFSDGAYVKQVSYADINMIPGATFGESSGFEVDEACGIKTFKAIVVSYETFDGQSWSNPLFADWCKLYEGVKLQ